MWITNPGNKISIGDVQGDMLANSLPVAGWLQKALSYAIAKQGQHGGYLKHHTFAKRAYMDAPVCRMDGGTKAGDDTHGDTQRRLQGLAVLSLLLNSLVLVNNWGIIKLCVCVCQALLGTDLLDCLYDSHAQPNVQSVTCF